MVIDTNTQKQFFSDGTNPIGQVVLLGSVPARIIGVVEPQTSGMGSDDTLNVYMPYTTVMSRMLDNLMYVISWFVLMTNIQLLPQKMRL